MSDDLEQENSEHPGLLAFPDGGPRKGRRWSLDVISPMFQSKKRSNAPLTASYDTASMGHRQSFSFIPSGGPSLSWSGFPLPWRRMRKTSEHASDHRAYIVVHPTEEAPFLVTVEDEGELRTLMEAARMEKKEGRVNSYRVIVAATRQTSRTFSDSSPTQYRSHQNLLQHLQAVAEYSSRTDDRLLIVTELLQSEQRYLDNLLTLYEQYAEPLRKFSSLSREDHRILFVGLEPFFKLSAALTEKLESAVATWDKTKTSVGHLFLHKFWSTFDDYYETYEKAKKFLKDQLKSNKEFENFCQLRQQNGVLSLQALLFLPIKRISDYDKYLNELLDETDTTHPDYDELIKAANRVKNMVKDREEVLREAENDQMMDTVQERFPYDDLQLKEREKAMQAKSRGLSLRRRSAPSAVVFKTLGGNKSRPQSNMVRKDMDPSNLIKQAADASRLYVMEGPVQFAMGMQTQDRYLFLFSDVLLVAKQKNSTTFKLKCRVPLCDVWLATCVDEVTELTRPMERSFVLGWPTCNLAATFRDPDSKGKWMSKLSEHMQEQKQRVEPKELPLKVVFRDDDKSETCQLTVSSSQQAKDVLQDCLAQLNIPESDSKDYKLWVWSEKEGSPYPLIGHETPFSIKVSHLRELARGPGEENMTQVDFNSVVNDDAASRKCEFILKQKKSPKQHSQDEDGRKAGKKGVKKPSPLRHIFRRGGRDNANDRRRDNNKNNNPSTPTGKLFGHPLATVCDSDNKPPKTVVDLLKVLFREGPHTTGILRKSAKHSSCQQLKEKLDQGEAMEETMTIVVGSVLKDYLRCLPDCLLMEQLYDEWVKVAAFSEEDDKLEHIKHLVSQLPPCNQSLLKYILCVLHRIQALSDLNKMTSYNLAVCISPSMLWRRDCLDLSPEVPAVQFLIDRCPDIFGLEVLQLLGDPSLLKVRPDSGTDSDSMHSTLGMQEASNGLRRADSSMDSLVERELYAGEGEGADSSPRMANSHLSPSNLSRDSGFTLSDTQLYEDECLDPNDNRAGRNDRHSYFLDRYEYDLYQLDTLVNPVPPPRKRGKKPKELEADHASRVDSGGGIRNREKYFTMHNSLSTSRLFEQDPSQVSSEMMNNRSKLTHSSFAHISEDSIQQSFDHRHLLQEYQKSDMGLLRMSASGAHLLLDDETLPRQLSELNVSDHRQSSYVDSTPPLSPQSKRSVSSRDSVISDSSFWTESRENSLASAPHTPDDDHADRLPPWIPAAEADRPKNLSLAANLNVVSETEPPYVQEQPLASEYSASQLRSVQNLRYLVSPSTSPTHEQESRDLAGSFSRKHQAFHVPFSLAWSGKSREAEDVTLGSSPYIHITQCSSSSDEKLDESELEDDTPKPSPAKELPLEISHSQSNADLPANRMSKSSQNAITGSPPPSVLLRSLRTGGSGKDPPPVKASHDEGILAQLQRSAFVPLDGAAVSGDAAERSRYRFDAARSMEAINDAEYILVKPRYAFIQREESIKSNISSYSSGSASSVGKDSVSSLTSSTVSEHSTSSSSSNGSAGSQSKEQSRPSKPPIYQAALQRKFMLAHDVPVEVLTQRQASERAKMLYEESLQKYLQERYDDNHSAHPQAHRKISDPGFSRHSSDVVGHASSESANPLCRIPGDEYATPSEDTVLEQQKVNYLHATEMYQQSLQWYEQQGNVGEPTSQQKSSSSKDAGPSEYPAGEMRTEGRIMDQFTEYQSQWDDDANGRQSRAAERRTGIRRNCRPKSMLEIPVSNLHRSASDSAERLIKQGQERSRSSSTARDSADSVARDAVTSAADSVARDAVTSAVKTENKDRTPAMRGSFVQSRTHWLCNSVLPNLSIARDSSAGSQSVVTARTSSGQISRKDNQAFRYSERANSAVNSTDSRHSSVLPSRGNATFLPARSESLRIPKTPVTSDITVSEGRRDVPISTSVCQNNISASSESRTRSGIAASDVGISDKSGAKSGLGWSVKSLRKIYSSEDAETAAAAASISSSESRPAPPPYQDPPPFRRLQDLNRLSTSSHSSDSSSNSTGRSASPASRAVSACPARKLGPQGVSVDYSSSEELAHYNNTRWSRAHSQSSSGSSDQETSSAYTDISYV